MAVFLAMKRLLTIKKERALSSLFFFFWCQGSESNRNIQSYENCFLPIKIPWHIWWDELVSNQHPRIFSPLHRPSLLSSHMVKMKGIEPLLQESKSCVLPLDDIFILWWDTWDLNSEPLGYEPSALTNCANIPNGTPTEIRTRTKGLEAPYSIHWTIGAGTE